MWLSIAASQWGMLYIHSVEQRVLRPKAKEVVSSSREDGAYRVKQSHEKSVNPMPGLTYTLVVGARLRKNARYGLAC